MASSSDRMRAFKHKGMSSESRRHDRQEAGIQLRKDKRQDQVCSTFSAFFCSSDAQEMKRRNLVDLSPTKPEVIPPVVRN